MPLGRTGILACLLWPDSNVWPLSPPSPRRRSAKDVERASPCLLRAFLLGLIEAGLIQGPPRGSGKQGGGSS